MYSSIIESIPTHEYVSESLCTTTHQVRQVLSKPKLTPRDLPALLSPAAEPYIEQIAQRSVALTRQRFGHTMQLFIPLYVSNECFNTCTYCGFSMEYKYKRVILSDDDIHKEARYLSQKGFKHVLLLTGESPKKVGDDYIAHAVSILSQYFSSVGIEVQPLTQSQYESMIASGADSLTLYQETYHYPTYKDVHLSGIKRRFGKRLDALEYGAQAGFYRLNLGALLGLYDWRYDALSLSSHLEYMMTHHWKVKYSVSFPRIQDMFGKIKVVYPTSNMALVQLICAFRLIYPDVGITLSTRESADLRDQLCSLGITTMSAESDTSPGGYTQGDAEEQFNISDHRSLTEVKSMLASKGLEPVMKDWDSVFTA